MPDTLTRLSLAVGVRARQPDRVDLFVDDGGRGSVELDAGESNVSARSATETGVERMPCRLALSGC